MSRSIILECGLQASQGEDRIPASIPPSLPPYFDTVPSGRTSETPRAFPVAAASRRERSVGGRIMA